VPVKDESSPRVWSIPRRAWSKLLHRTAAEQAGQVVSQAITAMGEINAASAKISDIVSTIDEISFHTNLLAMNAAVETARVAAAA
jgi:methyl-accepting chemotaxis protein